MSGEALANPRPGLAGAGQAILAWLLPRGEAAVRRRRAALTLLLAAGAAVRLLNVLQRKLIYHPRRSPVERGFVRDLLLHVQEEVKGYGYEVTHVDYCVTESWSLGFGRPLRQRATLVAPRGAEAANGGSQRLWVVAGGNAMWAADWLPLVVGLLHRGAAKQGLCFLLVDYPGYAENEGVPCQGLALRGGEAALAAALRRLRGRGVEPAALGFWGHSLGCAAVVQLAAALARPRPERLPQLLRPTRVVLSAPFTSIPDMGRALLAGRLPAAGPAVAAAALVSRHRWDNRQSLRALAGCAPQAPCTVHIVHGSCDEIVPVQMGRSLHRLCTELGLEGCTFTERPAASHNDVLEEAFDDFTRLVLAPDQELQERRPARM